MELINQVKNDYQMLRHKMGIVKYNLGKFNCSYSLYLLEKNRFKNKYGLFLIVPNIKEVFEFEIISIDNEIIQIETDLKYIPAFLINFLKKNQFKIADGLIDID